MYELMYLIKINKFPVRFCHGTIIMIVSTINKAQLGVHCTKFTEAYGISRDVTADHGLLLQMTTDCGISWQMTVTADYINTASRHGAVSRGAFKLLKARKL